MANQLHAIKVEGGTLDAASGVVRGGFADSDDPSIVVSDFEFNNAFCKTDNNEFYDDKKPTSKIGICQLKTLVQQLPRLSDTDIQLKWDQLPDVVVNIMSGTQRVGYIRYDAQTLKSKKKCTCCTNCI